MQAGVPQGSVISPTLFLIFINDLLKITVNPIHSFANDSTLHASYKLPAYHSASDVELSRTTMNDSINAGLMKILQWGESNLVLFNSSKTQNVVFSNKRSIFPKFTDFGDDIIDPSESLGILGINLDNSLIWHNHI